VLCTWTSFFFNRGGCSIARWGKSKVAEQQQLSLKGNSNSRGRVASGFAAERAHSYARTQPSQKINYTKKLTYAFFSSRLWNYMMRLSTLKFQSTTQQLAFLQQQSKQN
jgi:hypothetical protein